MRLQQLGLLLFFAALPPIGLAQDTSGSAPAPAAPAQASQAKTTPAPVAEKKKPKKVWTNDEIGSVKGGVSVVGDQGFSDDDAGAKASQEDRSKSIRQRQIANYRDQIQQLQGQIEAADKRISQLKNFKGENTSPSGGINPSQGYNMVPLEDQVKQLEERKKQLQARIQDIENDAKKNGIEPGDLR